jgi:hypothetical protein
MWVCELLQGLKSVRLKNIKIAFFVQLRYTRNEGHVFVSTHYICIAKRRIRRNQLIKVHNFEQFTDNITSKTCYKDTDPKIKGFKHSFSSLGMSVSLNVKRKMHKNLCIPETALNRAFKEVCHFAAEEIRERTVQGSRHE